MITSLTAVAAALVIGLPIFAALELGRERRSRGLRSQYTSPNRKATP